MDKKPYTKPALSNHGTVEAVTRVGNHDVFGGGFLSPNCKAKARAHGPADFGS